MQKEGIDGYVWQGAQYEGVVCDFVEILAGYGGSILSKDDPPMVTINRHEAHDALTEMVNWIWSYKISPSGPNGISTYEEDDARVRWQNGFAVFMRNWFNEYSLVIDPITSAVHAEVGYAAIPHAASQQTGHSCIGGWQLGVNASSENQGLCWELVDFVLNSDRTTGYGPFDIFAYQSLLPLYNQAVYRPRLPNYAQISQAIQTHVFQAVMQKETPATALANLQTALEQIISGA